MTKIQLTNILIFGAMIALFGLGCTRSNSAGNVIGSNTSSMMVKSAQIPKGFKEYKTSKISFQYPQELTLNDDYTNDENFDWQSNILVKVTTVQDAEDVCHTTYPGFAATSADKPLTELLTKLKIDGLTLNNYSDLMKLDILSCNGFGWSPNRAFPFDVQGIHGMVMYGLAGDDGGGGPEMSWITYTGVDENDNLYYIVLRPIFGHLANSALKMYIKDAESNAIMNEAIENAINRGKIKMYNDPKNVAFWENDLVDNIHTLNQVLYTITYVR